MTIDAELLGMARAATLGILVGLSRVGLQPINRMMLISPVAITAELALVALVAGLRILSDGLRMLCDPINAVGTAHSVTFIAESGPIALRMAGQAARGILLILRGVLGDPITGMRSRHPVAAIACGLVVASQAACLTLLLDLLLVPCNPVIAKRRGPSRAERLVASPTLVWSSLSIVACDSARPHRRHVSHTRALAVHEVRVTDHAAYTPVPVLLMGYLQSVIDDDFTGGRVALLAALVTDPAVGVGGIPARCRPLRVRTTELGLNHPGPAGHVVALVAAYIPMRGYAPGAKVSAHIVA
jgi:hypothetical protein